MKKKNLLKIMLAGGAFVLASCGAKDQANIINTTNVVDKEDTSFDYAENHAIYLLAQESGYNGTYEEWLESIRGDVVELQVEDNKLQWKYSIDSKWKTLLDISTLKGDAGISIASIEKTDTKGLIDIYTITMTDGSTTTFEVKNGAKGEATDGADGVGVKLFKKIDSDGLIDVYTIILTDGTTYTFEVKNGADGAATDGIDGIGIKKVELKKTEGLKDYYLITMTDDNTFIFEVTNGADGVATDGNDGNGVKSVEMTNREGLVDTYTITMTDGSSFSFTVTNGEDAVATNGTNGISVVNVEMTDRVGLVDTYTITLSDDSTYTFTITNGKDGVPTNGDDGVSIVSVEKTNTEGLVDTYTITLSNDSTYTFTITNGADGAATNGNDGKSAYETYIEAHPEYTKSEAEWLEDLASGNLSDTITYTVTYIVDGEEYKVDTVEALQNAKKPTDPTKTDAIFNGWYDENGDKWSFNGYVIAKDITLTAGFIPLDCTISFVTDSDEDIDPIKVAKYEEFSLPEPQKEGYQFGGWYFGEDLVDTSKYIYPSTIIVKAHWIELVDFKINMVDEGVTTKLNVTKHEPFTLPTPKKTGYTFDGWYIDGALIDETSYEYCKDVTVESRYTEILDFKITLQYDNGTADYTFDVTKYEAYTLSDPTKDGYTFAGWYNGTTKIEDTSSYEYLTDVTLVAHWNEIVDFTIYLDYGDGNDASSYDVIKHEKNQLPDGVKTDYRFDGWYYGTQLITKDDAWEYPDGITLVAKYTKVNNLQITFSCDPITIDTMTVDYEDSITLPSPIRYGYNFSGWMLNGEAYTATTFEYNEDIALVGTWTEMPENISFVESEGIEITDGVITGMGTCTDTVLYLNHPIDAIAFENKDYVTTVYIGPSVSSIGGQAFNSCDRLTKVVFLGDCPEIGQDIFGYSWDATNFTAYVKSDKIARYNAVTDTGWVTKMIDGNKLVALDSFVEHTYTFVTNSTLTADAVTDYTVGVLPSLEQDNKILVGWYVAEDFSGTPVTNYAQFASDTTLYAKWVNYDEMSESTGLAVTDGKVTGRGTNTDSVLYINKDISDAFNYDSSITTLIIGPNCTSIAADAFSYCGNLRNIYIIGSNTNVDSAAFDNLTNCTLHISYNDYSKYSKLINEDLKDVVYTDDSTTTVIYSYVTNSDETIAAVTENHIDALPLIYKEGYFFRGWYTSETFTGAAYFDKFYSSTNVTLYAKWEAIECDSDSEGLEYYGPRIDGIGTFTGSELYLNADIGQYSFRNCSTITTVYIGEGCSSIGYQAFANCTNLKNVYILGKIPSVSADIFAGTWDCAEFKVFVNEGYSDYYRNLSASYWKSAIVEKGKLYTFKSEGNKTYTFELNGGSIELDGVTKTEDAFVEAYSISALPTPTKAGYLFAGWYEDEEFTGNLYKNCLYYSSTSVTLYARWVLASEYLVSDDAGDSIELARIVSDEGTYTATVKADNVHYAKFTATKSGTIIIKSNSVVDPMGYFLNSTGQQLTYNDDDPSGGRNFYIEWTVEEGKTYYIKSTYYSPSNAPGSYEVTVSYKEDTSASE